MPDDTPRVDEPEPADMTPVKLPRRRKVGDAEMDITPMIDIVFLLLIFFLVASKMDEAAKVELPPARHGIDVSRENAIVVTLKSDTGNDVVVSRLDGLAFSNDLEQQEREIGEYIEAGLSGMSPFDRPMESIIVMAQGDVKEGEVARVSEAIGKVTDIATLNYAVLEEK